MDNLHYRLTFDLDKIFIRIRNIALQSLENLYTFVLRTEIPTTFGLMCAAISVRNTKVYKVCQICKAIFSTFYNISQPNFTISLILVCSF